MKKNKVIAAVLIGSCLVGQGAFNVVSLSNMNSTIKEQNNLISEQNDEMSSLKNKLGILQKDLSNNKKSTDEMNRMLKWHNTRELNKDRQSTSSLQDNSSKKEDNSKKSIASKNDSTSKKNNNLKEDSNSRKEVVYYSDPSLQAKIDELQNKLDSQSKDISDLKEQGFKEVTTIQNNENTIKQIQIAGTDKTVSIDDKDVQKAMEHFSWVSDETKVSKQPIEAKGLMKGLDDNEINIVKTIADTYKNADNVERNEKVVGVVSSMGRASAVYQAYAYTYTPFIHTEAPMYIAPVSADSSDCALIVVYNSDEKQILEDNEKEADMIDKVADSLIDDGISEKEAVIRINEYLCNLLTYQGDTEQPGAAMYTGYGCCQAYAVLFDEMARHVGIDTELVTGWGNDGSPYVYPNHIWDKAKVNGVWYYIDVCWNDTGSDRLRYLFNEGEMDDHVEIGLDNQDFYPY